MKQISHRMPTEILVMILAFLVGAIFQSFLRKKQRDVGSARYFTTLRNAVYQVVVIYLLIKIGFTGGGSILTEPLHQVLLTSGVAVVACIVWTVLLLYALKKWSPFDQLTRVSIAAHFGSVSVGTFIAAQEFLAALGIIVSSSVVVWLAIMELPALLVGVFALRISFLSVLGILKKDLMLWILVGSIFLGMVAQNIIPTEMKTLLFSTIFLPILTYFLFEMGAKAADSLRSIKGKYQELCIFGIGAPFVGGVSGALAGYLLGYGVGEAFMFSILMASASYVLVPISFKEILKNSSIASAEQADAAVATSMALSVGIALPFNIVIGFEIYYLLLRLLSG